MADLAFAALKEALKLLYRFYNNHKDSERELREVGNFIVDLGADSPILKAKTGRLNDVKNTLRVKLESASKRVEELSSRDSDFFRSGKRLLKIREIRQKVKKAMHEANTQMIVKLYEAVGKLLEGEDKLLELNREVLDEIRSYKAAKNAAVPKDMPKLGAQKIVKTPPPRSKSAERRPKSPSKAPPKPMPRVTPRRDKTVELYVPMDSEKQARDVVEKLKALPGVKNVISDQTSKKVLVVPHKGVTLNTDQLLQHARLENKFVAPTLWSKRPR